MLITRDDIQYIGDEDTLLHFLEEKLNLPIPPDLTLEDIATKFSNFALGLSGSVTDQVLDCQELSVSLGESSGILLIRFNSEPGYVEALRAVAEGLERQRRNPADLRFICANEHFQPFALAYFNNLEPEDWQTAVLTIFAWTRDNTHIYTSAEHELPTNFFADASATELVDSTEDNEKVKREDDFGAENVIPDEPEDNIEVSPSEDQNETYPEIIIKQILPESLFDKLESIGDPLSHCGKICTAIGN